MRYATVSCISYTSKGTEKEMANEKDANWIRYD
jgi:hypothetical protein